MLAKERKIERKIFFFFGDYSALHTHYRHRGGLSQADDALVRFLKGILKCFSHIKNHTYACLQVSLFPQSWAVSMR